MDELYLTKSERGKRFIYRIVDKQGNVKEDRISTNPNYIACSVDGEHFYTVIPKTNKKLIKLNV